MQPRLIVLMGVAAVTVLLPLAGASAGPVGDGDAKSPLPAPSHASPAPHRPAEARRNPALPAGLGATTVARCGPELSAPEGIEAQTCVLTQERDTWARTYYRNTTGDELTAVLTLMGPGGRTVQMHCAVRADDEPATCETPRERTAGEVGAYAAVAEYAAGEADGLLLRSGSNSARPEGS